MAFLHGDQISSYFSAFFTILVWSSGNICHSMASQPDYSLIHRSLVVNLDSVDLRIVAALQQDARLAITDLSRRVNLSPTPCTLRMRRLEKDKVILGYHARVAPGELEAALLVFVTVKLRATDESTLAAFNAAVKPVQQILECHMTGGGFDYLLKIRVRDMNEYREILGGIIGQLPMVEGTHSYFVMEEVKETSILPVPNRERRT
jgi:Lrp/AsnC family transcriptional regulator, leucine-responsive regulatory protein